MAIVVSANRADEPAVSPSEPKLFNTISPPAGKTLAEIKAAIVGSLNSRNWIIQEQSDNQVIASYNRRPISVTLTVKFDQEKIEVWGLGTGPAERLQEREPKWIANFVRDVGGALGGTPAGGTPDPRVRVTFHEVAPIVKDGAVIYVYWKRSMVGLAAGSWPVELDGQRVASLRQNSYVALKVLAGVHSIVVGGGVVGATPEDVANQMERWRILGTVAVAPNGVYFFKAAGFDSGYVPRQEAMKEIFRMVEQPSLMTNLQSGGVAIARTKSTAALPGTQPTPPGAGPGQDSRPAGVPLIQAIANPLPGKGGEPVQSPAPTPAAVAPTVASGVPPGTLGGDSFEISVISAEYDGWRYQDVSSQFTDVSRTATGWGVKVVVKNTTDTVGTQGFGKSGLQIRDVAGSLFDLSEDYRKFCPMICRGLDLSSGRVPGPFAFSMAGTEYEFRDGKLKIGSIASIIDDKTEYPTIMLTLLPRQSVTLLLVFSAPKERMPKALIWPDGKVIVLP